MTTYPLPTLAPTVDATGISVVPYSDILISLQTDMQNIFGSDIYIAPDSQDGQMLGIFALAISDAGQAMGAVFQSFSPTYSQGAQLSSMVKINGLARNVSGFSTAVGSISGVVGSTVTDGIVKDSNGNLWNLPASVTIPGPGSIAVTVTSQNPGAVVSLASSGWTIVNPQLGWQTFVSTSDASVGAAVESDPALKSRQSISTALPAQTVMDGILAAVANVMGVIRYTGYDNDTNSVDSNSVPAHTMVIIVQGGAVADIANAINLKKMPGAQTYGSTSYVAYGRYGIPTTINYFVLANPQIYFSVKVIPLNQFVNTTLTAIETALIDFINSSDIGYDVYYEQCVAVAGLIGTPLGKTFILSFLYLSLSPIVGTPISDLAIAFNAAAITSAANIAVTT